MTPHDTDEPRNQPRHDSTDRTVLALIRAGTRRCRLLAAFMAVVFGLVSQTAGIAYEQSGETVLYLDAPSVSSERATRAGEVASAYSRSGSSATEETLAWLALPDGGLELAEAPEEAREAFASVTTPGVASGVTAEEALEAGETMLAQLDEVEDGGGEEFAAAEAVRPRLGDDGSQALQKEPSEAEPRYKDEAAQPAAQPEMADPETQMDWPPTLASTRETPQADAKASVGVSTGEPDGAGLVVAESGAESETPDDGAGEMELASAPSETAPAPSYDPGGEEEREDYGPSGPVSDTGSPPAEEAEEEPETALVEEAMEEPVAGEPAEQPPPAQPTLPSVSEPAAKLAEESPVEPAESGPESTAAQPPQPANADTGPTENGDAEVALVPTSIPDGASGQPDPVPEELEPTPLTPTAEAVGPPESEPTPEEQPPTSPPVEYGFGDSGDDGGSEVAIAGSTMPSEDSPVQTSASPEDFPAGSQQFEIVVGGSASEAPVSPTPAPSDDGDYDAGGEPESTPMDSPTPVENPPTVMPTGGSSAPPEEDGPPERPLTEEAATGGAPIPAEPFGGGEGSNASDAPEVPGPAGVPKIATTPPSSQAGEEAPVEPTAAERREERRAEAQATHEKRISAGQPAAPWPTAQVVTGERQVIEQQQTIEQASRRQEIAAGNRTIAAENRVERLAARQAERQQVIEEQDTSKQAAIGQAAAIEQQAAEQVDIEQAAIERRQTIEQAAAEKAAIVAEQQQAAEQTAMEQAEAEQVAVVEQQEAAEQAAAAVRQVTYPASQQPQPTEQVQAQHAAPAPEVVPESPPSVSQPQVERVEYSTEVAKPTRQVEPAPQAGQPLPDAPTTEPGDAPGGGAAEPVVETESATSVEVGR